MKTFKLENGDLVYDAVQNIHMVQGPDEIVQSVRLLISINRGEWFLNKDYGLDYSAIQGVKWPTHESRIRDAFMEAFELDRRIEEVLSLSFDYERAARLLKVFFHVRAREGEVIDEVEVDL